MSWRNLLAETEQVVAPWIGGTRLRLRERTWRLTTQPSEPGWYTFETQCLNARCVGPAEPTQEGAVGTAIYTGYLVGNRIVQDGAQLSGDLTEFMRHSFEVRLIELGLGRFSRIKAAAFWYDGPLFYMGLEMPLGPEDEVQNALLDGCESIDHIRNVTPGLDMAFRLEVLRRKEAERRRAELEARRREEEERLAREARRQAIVAQLGSGVGRRQMAEIDFGEAARAALAVGGAIYLDHIPSRRRGEMIVQFRLEGRRFECVCDERTLQIIDSGICLTDQHTGERGDTYFTLESLPSVILEAIRDDVLHVYRHVD